MALPLGTSGEGRWLEILGQFGGEDALPSAAMRKLTSLAARLCETPFAFLSLVDEDRVRFLAASGLPAALEARRESWFCAETVRQKVPFLVPDAAQDARFAQHPLVAGEPGLRFYAGAPLLTSEGVVVGAFCVADRVARTLSAEQAEALQTLGEQAVLQLELRRRDRRLQESEERNRGIVESALDAVVSIDHQGRITEFNPAAERIFGRKREEALEQAMAELLIPERFREAHRRGMARYLATGETQLLGRRLEFIALRADGTEFPVELTPARLGSASPPSFTAFLRDLSEERRSAEALRYSEALFASVFHSNPAAIGIKTIATGRFREVNEYFCEFYGGERSEIIGKTSRETGLWVDQQQRDHLLDKVLATGSVMGEEVLLRRRDGAVREVFLSMERVEIPGEREQVLVVMFVDISERKQAELALRQSEARYRTLFEYAPDGILVARGDSVFLEANASICRMLGLAREELVGRDATAIVMPAEVMHIGPALQAIQAGAQYHREWLLRRRDGSQFPADVMATKMPDGNLLGMVRDISERKRAEARFRRLVDSNVQGVQIWNRKGEITEANDAFLNFLGYTREDLKAGLLNWISLTPPEYAEVDRLALEEIDKSGACIPFEKEYFRRDGARVSVIVGAASFADDPSEGVCFVLDVTEQKMLERQSLRAQRLESIGTLAGGIAHDLNNELGPIIVSLDLLGQEVQRPEALELIAMARASAQRGADMVRQILTFARGVEGRRIEVQLAHLMREVEKMANETFLKHIEVRLSYPRDLRTVVGDPTQLQQVLMNLCVNARDAMPDGGALAISAENTTIDASTSGFPGVEPGPYVLLKVEDNGTGMSPEVVDRIFDPFFTTKEFGKGTGLGLSSSLAIVTSHGGRMRVASVPGRGSTFLVYLPARSGTAGPAVVPPAGLVRGQGELILIVDDEPAMRLVAKRMLETFGYRVLAAASGPEAVEIFAARQPEIAVVLTDMMMPGMDGQAVIRAVRRMDAKIPIIATSGFPVEEQVAEAAELGVQIFLHKPFATEALLAALRQILDPAPTGSGKNGGSTADARMHTDVPDEPAP